MPLEIPVEMTNFAREREQVPALPTNAINVFGSTYCENVETNFVIKKLHHLPGNDKYRIEKSGRFSGLKIDYSLGNTRSLVTLAGGKVCIVRDTLLSLHHRTLLLNNESNAKVLLKDRHAFQKVPMIDVWFLNGSQAHSETSIDSYQTPDFSLVKSKVDENFLFVGRNNELYAKLMMVDSTNCKEYHLSISPYVDSALILMVTICANL